jgi:hypothetical protein
MTPLLQNPVSFFLEKGIDSPLFVLKDLNRLDELAYSTHNSKKDYILIGFVIFYFIFGIRTLLGREHFIENVSKRLPI